jgi:hypothetical protein
MSWYRASGVSLLFATVSYGAAAAHGHFICADELTIALVASFFLFAVAGPACLVIGFIRSWTASKRSPAAGG